MPRTRLIVELARGVQQCLHVRGAVEGRSPRRRGPNEPASTVYPHRVPLEEIPFDSDIEDLAEEPNRFVDRRRREPPIGELPRSIAVYLGDGDLHKRVVPEERQEMMGELPAEHL